MIPQDLIEFVKANRPAVLPGRILYRDSDVERFRFGDPTAWPMYHAFIDEDHAAALMTAWLIDELRQSCLDITYHRDMKQWYATVVVKDRMVMYKSRDKLHALWEAYKRVKGSKE